MPVLISYKILKIWLKLKGYALDEVKYGVFQHLRESNSESEQSDLAGIQSCLRFYGCPGYL